MSVPQHRAAAQQPASNAPALATAPNNTTNSTTAAAPNPPKEWSEDDYILALAHLEHLQDVVTSLRTTIPQLVRSLTRKHDSPQALFVDFSKEAIGGSQKLADLRKLWERGDMRDIQVKVGGSVREYGKGIEGVPGECVEGVREAVVEMPRYGWRDAAEEVRAKKRGEKADEGGDDGAVTAASEESTVEEFRKRHEHVKVEFDSSTRHVTVDVQDEDGVDIHFDIEPHTSDGKTTYQVSGPRIPTDATPGQRKLRQAIQRYLADRPKAGQLDYTLNTLAAYKDLAAAQCDVCKHYADGEMQLPAIRRSKRVKGDAGEEIKWVAVHESCVKEGT